MTLILTTATANKVVQASDRRLTWPDGSIADDEANKAVCVACLNAHFAVAYTGRSKIGHMKTDEWIADSLFSMKAGEIYVGAIVETLKQQLTTQFQKLRTTDPDNKRLSVVLAGYKDAVPFVVSISNQEDERGQILSTVKDIFESYVSEPKSGTNPKSWLLVQSDGATQAIDRLIEKRLRELRRKRFFYLREPEVVSRELVQLIRIAARSQIFGQRIGRSCMTVSMTPNVSDGFSTLYHPRKVSPYAYMPRLVLPGIEFADIQIGPITESSS